MNDTAIVDWIEQHVIRVHFHGGGRVRLYWLGWGKERVTAGDDLRDAVKKASGETAATAKEASSE